MGKESLRNAVVVITGASSGIGRSTAIMLARRGAIIVAASRTLSALQSLEVEIRESGGTILSVQTDVAFKEDVRRLVTTALQQFGKIDIVVCNAGVYLRHPVRDSSLEEYERCMAVNFYGSVHLVLAVLPHMLGRKSGHIVVVSSVDGKKGLPLDAPYVASKFALVGFTDVLRQELRGTGVHASTVLPGRVDTPMIGHLRVPFVSAKVSPERAALAIVSAIRRRKAETIVPSFGPRLLVVISAILPRMGDLLVRLFKLEGSEESAQCE